MEFPMHDMQHLKRRLWYLSKLTAVFSVLLMSLSVSATGQASTKKILRVGPLHTYTTISQAAKAARDGDSIEIEAGLYEGLQATAIWSANNLVIRGVGGRPHLEAKGFAVEGKGLWVIKGNDITIENIEFSGAKTSDGQGSALRTEGKNPTLRYCFFHDNQKGV